MSESDKSERRRASCVPIRRCWSRQPGYFFLYVQDGKGLVQPVS